MSWSSRGAHAHLSVNSGGERPASTRPGDRLPGAASTTVYDIASARVTVGMDARWHIIAALIAALIAPQPRAARSPAGAIDDEALAETTCLVNRMPGEVVRHLGRGREPDWAHEHIGSVMPSQIRLYCGLIDQLRDQLATCVAGD